MCSFVGPPDVVVSVRANRADFSPVTVAADLALARAQRARLWPGAKPSTCVLIALRLINKIRQPYICEECAVVAVMPSFARRVAELLEQVRRRVVADLRAHPGADFRAVAPVHAAPHTCVALLGVDIVDALVVSDGAAGALEVQRKVVRTEPHRVEPRRGGTDHAVSRNVFRVGRCDDERDPPGALDRQDLCDPKRQ